MKCIDEYRSDCAGEVEYRLVEVSVNLQTYPRCAKHFKEHVERADRAAQRYPQQQPQDFDPAYAGERWEEEE